MGIYAIESQGLKRSSGNFVGLNGVTYNLCTSDL